jgi:D-alanyl-D-alanine carboxypeptidase/D-alanyl-D-alanine-endopeptidase (penicillin-binding protein 4)
VGGRVTRAVVGGVVVSAVVTLGAAVVRGSSIAGHRGSGGSAAAISVTPDSIFVPAPGATTPAGADDVLIGLSSGAPLPTTTGLHRALSPLLAATGLGNAISMQVVDVATGTSMLAVNPDARLVPASTAKLLTGAAVLSTAGPTTTLDTEVVDGATAGEIVLVGGGDVLLGAGRGDPDAVAGHAGLADLADRTVAALRPQGRTSVAVRLDDTLFRGPAVSPAWRPGDVAAGYVAPVMALEVNAGRLSRRTARQSDPAMAAARTFASLVSRRGITVTGPVVRKGAPRTASVLARVESASVADQVEYALTESDNTVAEALARVVALRAGRPATFAEAGRAVLEQVEVLGVPTAGDRLVGGSGLADGSAISVRTLTSLLALAGSWGHPELRAVLTGLPVAGASGTLADRFAAAPQRGGLGVVRAKTGTLKGVNSLAGTVVDADGRLLAFAILADRTGAANAARSALDNVAVALARCGCR